MTLSAQLARLFNTEPVADAEQRAAVGNKISPSDTASRLIPPAEKTPASSPKAGAVTEDVPATNSTADATARFSPERGGEPA